MFNGNEGTGEVVGWGVQAHSGIMEFRISDLAQLQMIVRFQVWLSHVEVTAPEIMDVQVCVSGWLIYINLDIIQNYDSNDSWEKDAGPIIVN